MHTVRLNRVPGAQSMVSLPSMNAYGSPATSSRGQSTETCDAQRTINVWHNLSTDCVQASSVNMFKNKIDKYLVKAGFT